MVRLYDGKLSWNCAGTAGIRCVLHLERCLYEPEPEAVERSSAVWSQQALAEKVGVSRQTINAIEKGDYNPTIRLCIAICRELDKTLDEIFWEEEEC